MLLTSILRPGHSFKPETKQFLDDIDLNQQFSTRVTIFKGLGVEYQGHRGPGCMLCAGLRDAGVSSPSGCRSSSGGGGSSEAQGGSCARGRRLDGTREGQSACWDLDVVGRGVCGKTVLLQVFARDLRTTPRSFLAVDKGSIELNMWDSSGSHRDSSGPWHSLIQTPCSSASP